ncbi:hypothetical protein [Winogradskya humida]|uniref:Uncharacterized protein n=1 Tax=Winogradskya humida TaxID=113566 RepID=A0ABQ4A2H4_9ACTN|nr:hypothetical protein [Actinoplanes humidus]GIE25051.1 hypothetical protein Ahu01nite_081530 [Actinoplanes humidus]
MRRTDVIVPGHLISGLEIPPLAVTTGVADIEWVDVPAQGWFSRKQPAQRLPLDPRSARLARRYVRRRPWYLVIGIGLWLALLAGLVVDPPGRLGVVAHFAVWIAFLVWTLPIVGGALPPQTLSRSRDGDLRIRHVPVEVAEQWVQRNPGVVAGGDPAPRSHSRTFYAGWAAALIGVAIVLWVTVTSDVVLWMLVPAGLIAGVVVALKLFPPGYIGFGERDF